MNSDLRVDSSNNIQPYLSFDCIPDDVSLKIITLLRPKELICFLTTCRSLQNLKEKAWEILFQHDFNWVCSPAMKISPNSNVSWQKLYIDYASRLDWKVIAFGLNLTPIDAGLDNNGNLFDISYDYNSNYYLRTWNLDGVNIRKVAITDKLLNNCIRIGTRFLPQSEAILSSTNEMHCILWKDSIPYTLNGVSRYNFIHELDRNLFAYKCASRIHFFHLTPSGTLTEKVIDTKMGNIIKIYPLNDHSFMTTHLNKQNIACIFKLEGEEWSKKIGSFKEAHICKIFPDGTIVSHDNQFDSSIFKIWKIDTSKEEVQFTLIKSIDLSSLEIREPDNLQIERLSNGDYVTYIDDSKLIVWSDIHNNSKFRLFECWSSGNFSRFLVCHDTNQIVIMDEHKVKIFTPFINQSAKPLEKFDSCKIS